MAIRLRFFAASFLAVSFLALAGFGQASEASPMDGALKIPDTQLEPTAWADLDGWASDDHAAAFTAFLTSCQAIVRARRALRDPRTMFGALREVCRRAVAMRAADEAKARAFFEQNFRPMRISKLGEPAGFLTGYYEPIVDGSRFPSPEFSTPIYRRPPDLVSAVPIPRGGKFPNNGTVGRRVDGAIVPYYDRAAIEEGAFDGQHLEICWLRDPIDAFFIQIQGSGQVRLEDGTILRINYDAHNGWPYTPVGRVLIERKEVPRDEMSMERIRAWMNTHPDAASEVRRTNRSFVFFRIVGLSGDQEAIGAQGIPLTARRSIAVDKAIHVYGTPFFIEADLPIDSEKSATKFRQLMVGQDTGSAIVGPARADLYFGAGDDAGRVAGRLRHAGRFAVLVPLEIDPVAAARNMPLPLPRPLTAVAENKVTVPLPRPRPDDAPRPRS